MSETRKLATILALDMVGYSRATEQDDSAAAEGVRRIRALLTSTADPLGGRIFNSAGDGFMLEFPTATAGLEAALALIEALKGLDPPLQARIGLHTGEVIVEQSGDLLGHAVNIAARLQQRARPGEIVLSEDVKRSARGTITRNLVALGNVKLDKMSETIDIYAAGGAGSAPRLRLGKYSRLMLIGGALLAAVAAGLSLQLPHEPLSPGRNGRVEVVSFTPLQVGSIDLEQRSARLNAAFARLLATGHVQAFLAPQGEVAANANRAELRIAGTIDRTGETISFGAQVIDRASEVVLWSTSFERRTSDIDGIEEEVGLTVAGVLRCALDERSTSQRPLSTEVFSLLLNACDATARSRTDVRAATRDLVAAAPNLGAAHALHALACMQALNEVAHAPEQAEPLRMEALRSAERALAINRRLPRAYRVLAAMADSMVESERLLQRGLEVDPENPALLIGYMMHLRRVGRLQASREAGDRVARVADLQVLGSMPMVAFDRAMEGDLAGAEQAVRLLESVHRTEGPGVRWTVAVWWESPAQVLPRLHELSVAAGVSRRSEDCFRQYLAELQRASAAVRGLPSDCDEYQGAWRIRMLAREGDIDGAYAALRQSEQQVRSFPGFVFYPEMREFRRDARFMPLMNRVGLVDYWLATNRWPDFCSDPTLPYVCREEAHRVSAAEPAP